MRPQSIPPLIPALPFFSSFAAANSLHGIENGGLQADANINATTQNRADYGFLPEVLENDGDTGMADDVMKGVGGFDSHSDDPVGSADAGDRADEGKYEDTSFAADGKPAGNRNKPDPENVKATPIPPALWLLGSGLIGRVAVQRRRMES